MSGSVGEHFILCLKCKEKIPLSPFPLTTQGPVRYQIENNRLSLYAKCHDPECQYENLYSVLDLLHGKSKEEK